MNTYLLRKEKTFWQWILISSQDPTQGSLMVKGVLVGVIPYLMTLLPLIGIHPSVDLNSIPDAVYSVVFTGLTAISSLMALIGAARKLIILAIAIFKPSASK